WASIATISVLPAIEGFPFTNVKSIVDGSLANSTGVPSKRARRNHEWFVAKMKIAQIAMIDWFGGAKYIPVRDYLAYNYTGTEVLDRHNRIIAGLANL
ncbi:Protein CREG1, partial [Operophtera brumata]